MVNAVDIKKSLGEFTSYYPMDNMGANFLRQLCEFVLDIDSKVVSEQCEKNFHWIESELFCEKYPIIKQNTLRDFVRYSDQPCIWNKNVGGITYIYPQEFMKFLVANKTKFIKIHTRAKRHNFFGLLDA